MDAAARTGATGWVVAALMTVAVAGQTYLSARQFIGDVFAHMAPIARKADNDALAYWAHSRANRYWPHDFPTKLGLGETGRALRPESTGSYMFDEALRYAPYHVPSLLASSEALTIRGNYERAQVNMERASAIIPENWRLHDVRARWHSAQGQHGEAMESMKLALQPERFPDAALYARAAWVAVAAGEFDAAERFAARMIAIEPSTPLAHFALGEVQLHRGDSKAASDSFWSALTIEEYRVANGAAHSVDWFALNSALAGAALENLQLIRATRGLAAAATLEPDNARLRGQASEIEGLLKFPEGLSNGSAHLHLGRALAAMGETQRALAALNHALPLLTRPGERDMCSALLERLTAGPAQ